MINRPKSNISLILILFFVIGCAPVPKLSPMQIRQITTRLVDGTYENVYRACLTVFQDQGYIIKQTDMDAGLIVANVDRASSSGSQVAQALFLGYVANKGTEVEVSCMVNMISTASSEVRISIQESQYGQASVWTGTSKQDTKTIYDVKTYDSLFNQIQLEVKRREAIQEIPEGDSQN